jgi:uncharacterized protein YbjT (DUF2867 family)
MLLDSPAYSDVHLLLRRPWSGASHPRLHLHVVDFDRLGDLPAVDDMYCCLGTTIRTAGSQDAFRRVDFTYVFELARRARQGGASRFAVVSALGADARSRVFYNRVKGEMETAVQSLGYPHVVIARPSLLVGDRAALGQPVRFFERLAAHGLRPLQGLLPAGVRPIEADTVARALLGAMLGAQPGVRIVESAALQHEGATPMG